jgi:hypothetical protein
MFAFFQGFAFDQYICVASVPFLRRDGPIIDDFATRFRKEDGHGDGDGTSQSQQEPKDRMPSGILSQKSAKDGSLVCSLASNMS